MPETFNKVVKIVVAKKMSDLILNYPRYGGYMNHLCFHQEFELLESLLEGSSKDIIGEERLKSLAESSDTGHLTANLLQCSAIMGTVANDGYLKKITDIYSKYPPKKIVNEYLMLNPENFKKIFQPEYFKERKINKNQKLLKSIQDFDTDFVRETMGDVDLHPLTLDKEGGFQKTTIEKRTNDIKELYNALKEGRGIMVKKNTLDSLRLLFSEKGEEIDDKIEEQILVVRGNAVGIIKSAIGDQKSIEDVARDNVEENLKYLKETLTAILKPGETLSKPAIEKNQKSPEL